MIWTPCSLERSLSGQLSGCCSIPWRTKASPWHLKSLGCGLPLSLKGQQRRGQQYHAPPAQPAYRTLSVLILSSAHCRRWTHPRNVPGDLSHACRAWWCPRGSSQAGGEGPLARRHRLDSQLIVRPQLGPSSPFFWALFSITPPCRSTSSEVSNTHGFSLLFPLRKAGGRLVWAVQYFCFGLVILETNFKTYVHFSSFMWQRQGRRDRPGKWSWNLPQSGAVFGDPVTRSLLQAGI